MSEREETVAVRIAEEGESAVVQMSSADFVAVIRLHEKYSRGMRDGARAVLSHQDLSGLRLPNLNFRGAILVGTDFSRADVSGTDFSRSDLFTANFDGAKAEAANFEKADLRGAHFHGTTLRGSNFRGADLRPGIFIRDPSGGKNPNSVEMNVAIARITEDPIVDMYGADLEGAELGGALMQRVNLSAANLQGVKADGTRMNGANLRGSILADADLSKTELYGAKEPWHNETSIYSVPFGIMRCGWILRGKWEAAPYCPAWISVAPISRASISVAPICHVHHWGVKMHHLMRFSPPMATMGWVVRFLGVSVVFGSG